MSGYYFLVYCISGLLVAKNGQYITNMSLENTYASYYTHNQFLMLNIFVNQMYLLF